MTTGTPIALLIENVDQRSKDYSEIKDTYRPGHADYTYDVKYGLRDYRGGGRQSARETAARVAAGAIARKITPRMTVRGALIQIGPHKIDRARWDWDQVDEEGRGAPEDQLLAVPRPRGLRPVRVRPRRGHPAHAGPRLAPRRDAQPGRALADARRGAGRAGLRGHERLPGPHHDRPHRRLPRPPHPARPRRESDLLEKVASGDWSDGTQDALKSAIAEYADDFGYDLDEDGAPLSDDDAPTRAADRVRSAGGDGDGDGDAGGGDGEAADGGERAEEAGAVSA